MKYLIHIFLLIVLTGCTCDPKIVKVPVFQTPEFLMPVRPVLSTDISIKSQSGVLSSESLNTKNEESNILELSKYATQLENLLISLKSINNTQQ
jgi:hypothetical protein